MGLINDEKFTLRPAVLQDTGLILDFIKRLADYEGLVDEVVADEQSLQYWMFDKDKAEAVIAEYDNEPIGFALFFHNFSTFLGRAGIYIEDVFIEEKYRGRGYGKAIFRYLSEVALERGCGRIEWWCLNWNEPSIKFYENLGARPMNDWTVYRLTEDKILELARGENDDSLESDQQF